MPSKQYSTRPTAQALEEAFQRRLPRVEAGAQGEHKLQRGAALRGCGAARHASYAPFRHHRHLTRPILCTPAPLHAHPPGYLPRSTYSSHWLRDGTLRRAVAAFLEQETAQMRRTMQALEEEASPYK